MAPDSQVACVQACHSRLHHRQIGVVAYERAGGWRNSKSAAATTHEAAVLVTPPTANPAEARRSPRGTSKLPTHHGAAAEQGTAAPLSPVTRTSHPQAHVCLTTSCLQHFLFSPVSTVTQAYSRHERALSGTEAAKTSIAENGGSCAQGQGSTLTAVGALAHRSAPLVRVCCCVSTAVERPPPRVSNRCRKLNTPCSPRTDQRGRGAMKKQKPNKTSRIRPAHADPR